jgi:zinc transporter 1
MPSKPHQNVRWYSTKTFRFLAMLSLTFSFFIVELVVGNITNSLALVADAFHMFSDVIALVIGLTAIRIAKRRSDINTFGWARAEVVGANINTIALLALSLTIVFDTIKRYIKPEPIVNVNLLLIVGSTGLGINIIGLFLFQGFHGHSHGGGTHGGEADGHGHAHGGETHGGETDGHGHSHGGGTHGGEADGHAHDANDRSRSVEISKTNIEINEDATISNENNRTAATHSDDIEPFEIIIGSSDFKRYSLRALDEVRL